MLPDDFELFGRGGNHRAATGEQSPHELAVLVVLCDRLTVSGRSAGVDQVATIGCRFNTYGSVTDFVGRG